MGTQEKFEVEKAAKNRAYSFIIAMGLLKEFSQFCDATQGIDPHSLAKCFFKYNS